MTPPEPPFQLVIFDMDGTLIEQILDFKAIRRDLGVAPDAGILEAIEKMPPDRRNRAERRLIEIERRTAPNARLMPGALETIAKIRNAEIKLALLTRNTKWSMQTVIAKFGLQFDLAWSREDGPIKPEPDGVLRACAELGAQPERTACVGDFEYDMIAANSAGACSILLAPQDRPPFANIADHIVTELTQLPALLGI